jgi:hypothetical protein
VWQRNYYERVVRSEDELNRIREYIRFNPLKWEFDRENPYRRASREYESEWNWLERKEGVPGEEQALLPWSDRSLWRNS